MLVVCAALHKVGAQCPECVRRRGPRRTGPACRPRRRRRALRRRSPGPSRPSRRQASGRAQGGAGARPRRGRGSAPPNAPVHPARPSRRPSRERRISSAVEVEMPLLPEQGREFGAVRRIGAPPPGLPQGPQERSDGRACGERRGKGQHLLRGVRHDVDAERRDAPQAGLHGDRVPRAADAETVDVAGAQRVDHLRRRHHDHLRRLGKLHAAPSGEGAELVGVGGEREHRRQPQRPALPPPARRDRPEGARRRTRRPRARRDPRVRPTRTSTR